MAELSKPPIRLAIISNGLTPYRVAWHRRIVREMVGEVELHSAFTHELSNAAWAFDAPAEIRPVRFGEGEDSARQSDPTRAVHEFRKGGRIIRWLREAGIHAVVMNGYNDVGRLRVIRACRAMGIPCFLFGDSNIAGDRPRGAKGMLKRVLVSRLLAMCTGALACGRLGRAYFERYGVPGDRVFYTPYEPDYAQIRDMPQSVIAHITQRLALGPGRRRIVFSGRLMSVKRPEMVIDAFCAIAPRRPSWDLIMMGDGPLAATLRQRVASNLKHRITWTGFMAKQDDVTAVYHASDVLILPSDYEPWAVVINEAAAAGLAIVCSNVVGAAAELVNDGINGKLFPPGDLNAITAALLHVTDPAHIELMKAASLEVLADWQRRGDPIDGLRAALRFGGLLA